MSREKVCCYSPINCANVSNAHSAPEAIFTSHVTNAKNTDGYVIFRKPMAQVATKWSPYGTKTTFDGVDCRDFEGSEEAREELEWALEELCLRIRNGDVRDLPEDMSGVVPWLKSTTRRPRPVYVGSTSRSIKKR